MASKPAALSAASRDSTLSDLLQQYGCGAIPLTGTGNALYDRHLLFDNVIEFASATLRDRFEALARSVRDLLSQRWLLTEKHIR